MFATQFQFHKGAIRTECDQRNCGERPEFQFHKGAIRTHYIDFLPSFLPEFQFHKGAIRTEAFCAAFRANFDFNSIKVRLEQLSKKVSGSIFSAFQFHKGAIRTRLLNAVPTRNIISIP